MKDTARRALSAVRERWQARHGPAGLDARLAHADPRAPFEERLRWLAGVTAWVCDSAFAPAEAAGRGRPGPAARLRYLLQALERNPDWKARVAACLRSLVRDSDGLELLCEVGLARSLGLGGELLERLGGRLVPSDPWRAELGSALTALFPRAEDADWLEQLDEALLAQLARLLEHDEAPEEAGWNDFERDAGDALLILASEARSLGLSTPVRRRLGTAPFRELPFFGLTAAAEELAVAARAGRDDPGEAERLLVLVERSEQAAREVFRHLDEHGVSVQVVFLVERLLGLLRRLRLLAGLVSGHASGGAVAQLLASLVREGHERRSLRALLRQNLHLLARKLVERNAETGEHYIARDRAEYRAMLRASAGGGVVAAFVTWLKLGLTALHLPPLAEGLLAAANYSVGFVAIQLMHFTLATKQPAATAAALAHRMQDLDRPEQLERFTDEVVHLVRSQAASIAGNLALVPPVALAVDLLGRLLTGQALLGPEKATQSVASLSLLGPSLAYAALTGVFLWLSSLAAGWADNWFALRRVGAGLARGRLATVLLGRQGAARVAGFLEAQVAGLAGNVSLGVLLGLVPALFAAGGLPVEIRHVTIATGQLVAACAALGFEVLGSTGFWLALLGVLGIGAVNLAVSFSLALWLAVRARGLAAPDRRALRGAILRRLLTRPLSFVYPVAAPPGSALSA